MIALCNFHSNPEEIRSLLQSGSLSTVAQLSVIDFWPKGSPVSPELFIWRHHRQRAGALKQGCRFPEGILRTFCFVSTKIKDFLKFGGREAEKVHL